jgi:hypothetical protein
MKKRFVFGLLLLLALVVMGLDLYRGMRVQRAVTGVLPLGTDTISFRSTVNDAHWVAVKSEDAEPLLRSYNLLIFHI